MNQTKLIWRSAAAIFLGLIIWIGWPLYGFVSNQNETGRLPWGWQHLPATPPVDAKQHDPSYAEVGEQALLILAERREQISAPSMSAAIAIDGKMVWAGAIGWRDVANDLPATIDTTYRIGSTSKAVGITGLARLVAEGELDLDTPIGTYSENLPHEEWHAFTPRQLASHTTGLAAYEQNNDWIGVYRSMALTTRFDDPEGALSVFDGADTLFSPQTDFHYSGFGNVLLSAIMQDAAGQPFDKLMSSHVFEPLGLVSTVPDHLRTKETAFAHSYQTKEDRVKLWRRVDLSHKLAAGGYVSTPTELALLGSAWLDDTFIPPSVRDEFWTPVALSDGEINEQNYALGFRRRSWSIEGAGETIFLSHGGVSKGAQTWFMIVPEHGLSLAISTNRRTDAFFDFADVYVDLLELFIPTESNMDG